MAISDIRKFMLTACLAAIPVVSLNAADDDFRIEWSRTRMDGSRTGCVTPSADNVPEALGRVKGKTYFAPCVAG